MAALQDIKARIASVQSTLKITSAMKMVASAKLHKTQNESLAFNEYSGRLSAMVSTLLTATAGKVESPLMCAHEGKGRAIVVAMASDMSLCGAFNHNAVRLLEDTMKKLREGGYERITVVPVGNKMVQAVAKLGYEVESSLTPDNLGDYLISEYVEGKADEVLLLYHHFLSVGSQKPVAQQLLPFAFEESGASAVSDDYIFEPSAAELMNSVVPYCVKTKVRAAVLDNTISEHAARMVAMQTATDNAKELLDELKLTYNKRRQQAITDELADIASNS